MIAEQLQEIKNALKTVDDIPISSVPKVMLLTVLEKKCDMYKQITTTLIRTIEEMLKKNDEVLDGSQKEQ